MPLETSYTSRSSGSATASAAQATEPKQPYWPLSKLRKCYTDYLFSKREEIDEQIEARRYYHGSQYTAEQIAALRKRKQPIMTFNRISRKIDGVVGVVEQGRQDPKAFPRTPQQEQGAELATAAVRYVLDAQDWKAKSALCSMVSAVDGVGGIELDLIQGDHGDPDIGVNDVDVDSFFYDPRSHRWDFSDARYMGVGKWIDDDIAAEMFPDADVNAFTSDDELVSNSDREARWFRSDGVQNRVRVVEIWYKHGGGWCWAVFSGNAVLKEGRSPFKDEKKAEICKYIMFSACVDQDGDRYGFVRNMKSPQDGINAKQSKMQHILASKRLILSQGAVDDVEKTRAEWARPDGVVVTNRPVNEGVKTDDQSFDFAGWVKMLELNLSEIENFGPNRTLLGEGGVDTRSGRAIAMLKQSGLAELGPFILSHRGWKIRAYRAIWSAIQNSWQAERWIRVTDDEGLAQFIQVNGLQIDPQTGQPTLVNAVGSLDVDIILDEAPDTINMMQDFYETLQQVLPAVAPMLSPPKASAMVDMLIESSPMASTQKKKYRDAGAQEQQQPNPAVVQAQAEMEMKAQSAEADIAIKEKTAEHDMSLKERMAKFEAALEADKHVREMDYERERKMLELDHEDQREAVKATYDRAKMDREAERDGRKMDHESRTNEMKLEHEKMVRREQTRDPTAEAVINTTTEALDRLSEGLGKVGEQLVLKLDNIERAFLAPTKLIRDSQGRPIAAEKSVR